jgi:hypothetical protein
MNGIAPMVVFDASRANVDKGYMNVSHLSMVSAFK